MKIVQDERANETTAGDAHTPFITAVSALPENSLITKTSCDSSIICRNWSPNVFIRGSKSTPGKYPFVRVRSASSHTARVTRC